MPPSATVTFFLRLQNNIKVRLIQDGDLPRAAAIVERMLTGGARDCRPLARRWSHPFAPRQSAGGASSPCRAFLETSDNEAQRHQVARLLQDITQRLQRPIKNKRAAAVSIPPLLPPSWPLNCRPTQAFSQRAEPHVACRCHPDGPRRNHRYRWRFQFRSGPCRPSGAATSSITIIRGSSPGATAR